MRVAGRRAPPAAATAPPAVAVVTETATATAGGVAPLWQAGKVGPGPERLPRSSFWRARRCDVGTEEDAAELVAVPVPVPVELAMAGVEVRAAEVIVLPLAPTATALDGEVTRGRGEVRGAAL